MTVLASLITVPTSGTVTVFTSQANNANQLSIRNTGTVNLLLGAPGNVIFPLLPSEFIGLEVGPTDTLLASIQSGGTQGQIAVLACG